MNQIFLLVFSIIFSHPTQVTTPALEAQPAIVSFQAVASTTILFGPDSILQGEPLRITTEGLANLKTLTFDGKEIPVFWYNGKNRAFIGIELSKKPGSYVLRATLSNGDVQHKNIKVVGRKKPALTSVPIPATLGGNTSSSQQNLVTAISSADDDIKNVITASSILWSTSFIPPLANITVTNPYGYSVDTGATQLAHKGTDLKAAIGTPVYAMNRGTVKIARRYDAYGNMIVVDHGLGVQTLYLHLSRMDVHEGDVVSRGEVIGLSGDTGYVSGPHLHLSIRIGGTSIDPMKFLELFGYYY